jgi:hypothetical protein
MAKFLLNVFALYVALLKHHDNHIHRGRFCDRFDSQYNHSVYDSHSWHISWYTFKNAT